MKIVFSVPTADLALAAIQMENQYFLVSDILPILENISMVDSGADTYIYLTINKLVQSAGTYAAPVFTVSANWQRLDNTQIETWKNFNVGVTVNKFVKGTTYLIPADQFAPLNMIPNFINVLRANSGLTFAGTSFMFQCGADTEILNDTDIPNTTTVEFLGAVALEAGMVKAQNKKAEQAQLMIANGVPAQIAQLVMQPAPVNNGTPVKTAASGRLALI